MPTTVNGIGTHYYGRKNRSVRDGICQACNRRGQLESYDTRLYFVVVFIPVIPLGRKRILDECPACRRHWAASADQWAVSGQLNVSGARDRYRTAKSVESALEAHATMLSFRLYPEAEAFRTEACADHPDSALLHAALGSQLDAAGAYNDATPLFERALQLDRHLPEARIGLAFRRMNKGELDEARNLLDVLMQPGAGQLYALGPLETLANLYQAQGRHEEVVRIGEHLLSEFPQAGQVRPFRKFIGKSEQALGRRESILPAREVSVRDLFNKRSGKYADWQRWMAIGGIAAAVAVACLAVHNEHRRRNRVLHVVNALPQPAILTIDDSPPMTVASTLTLPVAEGRHRVKVAGTVTDEFDIDLGSGYVQRWTKKPAWIVNVGGAAAFERHTIYYAANPRPTDVELLLGEPFVSLPHIDHLFAEAPASLRVENRNQVVVRQRLTRSNVPPAGLFLYAMSTGQPSQALAFAESHLAGRPEDDDLLTAYANAAQAGAHQERAERFLKSGLSRRPVEIEWHRAYQGLGLAQGRDAALAEEYQAVLEAEPGNAALLYLCGRVVDNRSAANELFRRSSEADPALVWPWRALAHDAASRGAWDECRTCLAPEAVSTSADPGVRRIRHLMRLHAGEYAELEAGYRQQLATLPPDEAAGVVMHLIDVLAVQGRADEARQEATAWENRLPPADRSQDGVRFLHDMTRYMLGEFDPLPPAGAQIVPMEMAFLRLHMLAAAGKPGEIVADPTLATALQGTNALAVSLAFRLAGDEAAANDWNERACAELEKGDADSKRAAVLLRGADPPDGKALDEVMLDVTQKVLLVAALAARFPQAREPLTDLARRLNVSRAPPYHLVQRVTSAAP